LRAADIGEGRLQRSTNEQGGGGGGEEVSEKEEI
jgi:hypothetical protein